MRLSINNGCILSLVGSKNTGSSSDIFRSSGNRYAYARRINESVSLEIKCDVSSIKIEIIENEYYK
jgi:hypothetical protein